ncbi:hypothetical protein SCHPADRAFT_346888 [Schizopora paradoxa]|uniref:Uncharacterized protein n=1 Tax=Schizopora paradoxa TaxID=27342 RepID=A0A0H2RPI8_9AGAM|nr:hypothetical protein SCHPADRAFT_346888 [Schizopora paradoxa]
MRDFSLTVVPLREVFVSVERATCDADDCMVATAIPFAQLPVYVSAVPVPENCIHVFATPGFCNRPWRCQGRHPIEEVTFFVLSELWHRKMRKRCFVLHEARFENDNDSGVVGPSVTTTQPSSTSRTRLLRTTQVGLPVTITNTLSTDFSSCHCIFQSGRIAINGARLYALSIQSFLAGSDRSPLITLDNHPINMLTKDIAMDPYSGAICCWESGDSEATIQILHFD